MRYPGISFHKPSGKWRGKKTIKGRTYYSKYYATPEEAYQAMIAKGYGVGAADYSGLVRTLSMVAGVPLGDVDRVIAAAYTVGFAVVPAVLTAQTYDKVIGHYDVDIWTAAIDALQIR